MVRQARDTLIAMSMWDFADRHAFWFVCSLPFFAWTIRMAVCVVSDLCRGARSATLAVLRACR